MPETRKKWSQYRKEAKRGPFVIELDEGEEDIVIPEPDTETLMDLSELPQNEIRKMVRLLCRDQFDRVYELVRHEPVEVMNELLSDMLKHFGYEADVPGGSRASSS